MAQPVVLDAAGQVATRMRDDVFDEDMEKCFDGYGEFQFLYASNQLYVLRARDTVRGMKVYFKAVLSEAHVDAMTRLRHEWNCQLFTNDIAGVKKPHALESCNEGRGLMLIFTDEGELPSFTHFGRDLHRVTGSIDLDEFLDWAIEIAKILDQLHTKGITHANINPYSIGVQEDRAMIFDLTCSIFLEREDAQRGVISYYHLPFMSPESSGRINRSIDYRTDFYSLGICFYFLLTGQCPFQSDSALDLIYKHIAQEPVPPHELGPIPESFSAVVLKLISKTAEDRYQTAKGLVSDLEALRARPSKFQPGLMDAASQFTIPQRLFWRDDSIKELLGCFSAAKRGGNVVIVKGSSGTGKSSLVHEIHRPILESKSFFASGKFDQYKRGIPFFSLIQAGSELIRQLVSEDEYALDEWKESLLQAMGNDVAAVFDVLPELQALFADVEVPTLPDLGPVEREQRFTAVFLKFLLVFCRQGHPLVLFLDDIQWSSAVELNLVAKIAIAASSSYSLCLIVAYRDNEVPDGHHALSMLREIEEARVPVRVIEVKPMSLDAARAMIAATMRISPSESDAEFETLAKLIVARSSGNAFFITQLLKSLKESNHIFFDFKVKAWQFDLPGILREDLPVTVVDLLLSQMQTLSERTRECMHMAACLGTNRFSLRLLAAVSQQSIKSTAQDLWHALQAGLVVPTSSAYKLLAGEATEEDIDATYRFLHDRVQQAAYQLKDDQPRTHFFIGFQLLNFYTQEGLVEAFVFEIVNQINRALYLLEESQLALVIELNVKAGKRALQSTAFDAAMSYLEIAKTLAPESWWTTHFDQSLDINLSHVDATYANNDYETAIMHLTYIASKARSAFERAQIMSRMVDTYNVMDDLNSAIDVGIRAMELLDFSVPRTEASMTSLMQTLRPKLDLSTKQIDDIARRPLTKDPRVLLLQTLASAVLLPIYCNKPELLQVVCAQVLLLSLKHGISDAGAYSLLMYGVTLTHGQLDAKARLQGYHMGLAAIKIVDTSKVTTTTTKVLKVFASHICWWNEPARACLVYFNSAMTTGIQTFNVEYTCYAYTESCSYAFLSGESLATVVPRMSSYLPLIKKYKQIAGVWYCSIQLQAYTVFASDTDDLEIDGEHFSLALEYDALMTTSSHPQIFVLYLYRFMVGVYFHRSVEQTMRYNEELEKYSEGSLGTAYVAKWSFLLCSCLVQNFSTLSPVHLAKCYDHLSRLRFYNSGEATSFAHEITFLEAEQVRHENILDAMEKYETAYELACTVGNIHEAGFFAERTYRWLESKQSKLANKYILRANECFRVAGFTAKMRDLATKYPDLLSPENLREPPSNALTTFRNVNMQMNRDGTLSKIAADAKGSAEPSEYTASKGSKRAPLSTRESAPRIEADLTPNSVTPTTISSKSRRNPRTISVASESSEGVDLDLEVALKASVLISDVLQVPLVLKRLVETVLVNAGADYGALMLIHEGDLYVEAIGRNGSVEIIQHECLSVSKAVPTTLVKYVGRLKETIVTGQDNLRFGKDAYFTNKKLRSIMCMPVQNSVKLIGVLYLENSVTAYAFGPRRVELLNFLCSQAAIAIEKARLYSELEVAKNEAQASNKMKSEFLSTISHEIRTPFNSVLGMSGFLLDTSLTPMQIDYVETIRNSSRELLRVIDDILDFSKMEHGNFDLQKESFSLRECIEGAMQITAERAATKELELAYFNNSDDYPDIVVNDVTRFRQVLINLVGNSIKFTEKGSVIVEATATLLREAGDKDALYRIHISVKDTGIGIKEEDHNKLFKLFSQIDSSLARHFTGTGLGLAISERLVRLMDGQIWVESTLGVGSTFHFTITTEVKQKSPQAPQDLVKKLTGHSVLILDDSEIATRALSESLQWLGLRTVVIRDVEAFVHVMETVQPGSFSIALIDVHYGLTEPLLPEFVAYDPKCKIIRLSRIGVRQSFDNYQFLIKPVKRDRLARTIAEVMFPGLIAEPIQDVKPAGLAERHPLRILLAEDNMINARVALQHLKRMGYTATHAKDGQYALEEEDKAIYDVILMDVQMPRLDGCQAATRLRQKYRDSEDSPRIIAMTANAMRGDMERCLAAGMHDYTAKPIHAEILAKKLMGSKRRSI